MARKVPRLSEHYLICSLYYFTLGAMDGILPWPSSSDHSVWFYLMAAWFYEDDDSELATMPA